MLRFNAMLNKRIENATRIEVKYEEKGKTIAEYNENEKPELKRFLKKHPCTEFTRHKDGHMELIVVPDGYMLCKYCGHPHKTNNKDLLCPECRETFGHTLYSEL